MDRDTYKDEYAAMDAQAEIARLQAEVERLTDELTASCARAELQQREAERLRRNNGVLHDTIETIFKEGAKQLARANAARNDALEDAAVLADYYADADYCAMGYPEEGGIAASGTAHTIREAIRALKEPP